MLDRIDRPFKRNKFAEIVTTLSTVATVAVEIILGLPGDTPEGFKETIRMVRDLPASVRIYHCLVLPDAFMAKESGNLRFHPITLELIEGPGWSERDLRDTAEWLDANAHAGVHRLNHAERVTGTRLEDFVHRLADPPWWLVRKESSLAIPSSPHAPQGR